MWEQNPTPNATLNSLSQTTSEYSTFKIPTLPGTSSEKLNDIQNDDKNQSGFTNYSSTLNTNGNQTLINPQLKKLISMNSSRNSIRKKKDQIQTIGKYDYNCDYRGPSSSKSKPSVERNSSYKTWRDRLRNNDFDDFDNFDNDKTEFKSRKSRNHKSKANTNHYKTEDLFDYSKYQEIFNFGREINYPGSRQSTVHKETNEQTPAVQPIKFIQPKLIDSDSFDSLCNSDPNNEPQFYSNSINAQRYQDKNPNFIKPSFEKFTNSIFFNHQKSIYSNDKNYQDIAINCQIIHPSSDHKPAIKKSLNLSTQNKQLGLSQPEIFDWQIFLTNEITEQLNCNEINQNNNTMIQHTTNRIDDNLNHDIIKKTTDEDKQTCDQMNIEPLTKKANKSKKKKKRKVNQKQTKTMNNTTSNNQIIDAQLNQISNNEQLTNDNNQNQTNSFQENNQQLSNIQITHQNITEMQSNNENLETPIKDKIDYINTQENTNKSPENIVVQLTNQLIETQKDENNNSMPQKPKSRKKKLKKVSKKNQQSNLNENENSLISIESQPKLPENLLNQESNNAHLELPSIENSQLLNNSNKHLDKSSNSTQIEQPNDSHPNDSELNLPNAKQQNDQELCSNQNQHQKGAKLNLNQIERQNNINSHPDFEQSKGSELNLNNNKQQNDQELDENQQPMNTNSHPNQINQSNDYGLKPIQFEQHVDILPHQEIIPKEKVESNNIKTSQNANSIDVLQKQDSVSNESSSPNEQRTETLSQIKPSKNDSQIQQETSEKMPQAVKINVKTHVLSGTTMIFDKDRIIVPNQNNQKEITTHTNQTENDSKGENTFKQPEQTNSKDENNFDQTEPFDSKDQNKFNQTYSGNHFQTLVSIVSSKSCDNSSNEENNSFIEKTVNDVDINSHIEDSLHLDIDSINQNESLSNPLTSDQKSKQFSQTYSISQTITDETFPGNCTSFANTGQLDNINKKQFDHLFTDHPIEDDDTFIQFNQFAKTDSKIIKSTLHAKTLVGQLVPPNSEMTSEEYQERIRTSNFSDSSSDDIVGKDEDIYSNITHASQNQTSFLSFDIESDGIKQFNSLLETSNIQVDGNALELTNFVIAPINSKEESSVQPVDDQIDGELINDFLSDSQIPSISIKKNEQSFQSIEIDQNNIELFEQFENSNVVDLNTLRIGNPCPIISPPANTPMGSSSLLSNNISNEEQSEKQNSYQNTSSGDSFHQVIDNNIKEVVNIDELNHQNFVSIESDAIKYNQNHPSPFLSYENNLFRSMPTTLTTLSTRHLLAMESINKMINSGQHGPKPKKEKPRHTKRRKKSKKRDKKS